MESHLIVLIKKQSIIVNKYFSLPRLEVFLPALALPSGQEFHACYAGDDMDCSLALQGIKLAIYKVRAAFKCASMFLLISPPTLNSFLSPPAIGAHRDPCCIGFYTWPSALVQLYGFNLLQVSAHPSAGNFKTTGFFLLRDFFLRGIRTLASSTSPPHFPILQSFYLFFFSSELYPKV